jgi:hypothetical protein
MLKHIIQIGNRIFKSKIHLKLNLIYIHQRKYVSIKWSNFKLKSFLQFGSNIYFPVLCRMLWKITEVLEQAILHLVRIKQNIHSCKIKLGFHGARYCSSWRWYDIVLQKQHRCVQLLYSIFEVQLEYRCLCLFIFISWSDFGMIVTWVKPGHCVYLNVMFYFRSSKSELHASFTWRLCSHWHAHHHFVLIRPSF